MKRSGQAETLRRQNTRGADEHHAGLLADVRAWWRAWRACAIMCAWGGCGLAVKIQSLLLAMNERMVEVEHRLSLVEGKHGKKNNSSNSGGSSGIGGSSSSISSRSSSSSSSSSSSRSIGGGGGGDKKRKKQQAKGSSKR